IFQARKIGRGVTTFISADRNGMIESFEDLIGIGRKRLLDQFDAEFFQRWNNSLVMSRRPRFVGVDKQTRRGRGFADRFDSREIDIVTAEFEFQTWPAGIRSPR